MSVYGETLEKNEGMTNKYVVTSKAMCGTLDGHISIGSFSRVDNFLRLATGFMGIYFIAILFFLFFIFIFIFCRNGALKI